MLRTALGPAIAGHLEDPGVAEVMLNPDGRLWVDRLSGGLEDTGVRIPAADAERIVRLVAHHVGVEVHAGAPRAVVIINGTLAAAIGLGLRLWLAGAALWLIGHLASVWAAKRDPAFVDVVRRHLRYPQHLVA